MKTLTIIALAGLAMLLFVTAAFSQTQEETAALQKVLDRPVSQAEIDEEVSYLEGIRNQALRAQQTCGAQHERIKEIHEDFLDVVDDAADFRGRHAPRYSRASARISKRVETAVTSAHVAAQRCVSVSENNAAIAKDILSNPAKVLTMIPARRTARFWKALSDARELAQQQALQQARAEALRLDAARKADAQRIDQERKVVQLRHELETLLKLVHSAAVALTSPSGSYEAFGAHMQAVNEKVQSISAKYPVGAMNEDAKTLARAASQTWSALSSASTSWTQERLTAKDVASTQDAVTAMTRGAGGPTGRVVENLKLAQGRYAEAKNRLTISREAVALIMRSK